MVEGYAQPSWTYGSTYYFGWDRIIYDADTGEQFVDPDGFGDYTGTGPQPVLIAVLEAGLTLSAANLWFTS